MTETDKNTLPEELKDEELNKWIEQQCHYHYGWVAEAKYDKTARNINTQMNVFRSIVKETATALYAHLKPLMNAKELEMLGDMKILLDKINVLADTVLEQKKSLDAKDEEIERLNKILEDNVKADKRLQKLTK